MNTEEDKNQNQDRGGDKEGSLNAGNNKIIKNRNLNIKQVFLKRLDFKALVNPIDYQDSLAAESNVNIHIHHEKKTSNEYIVFLTIELDGFDDDKRANKIFSITTEVFGIFEIGGFDSSERNLLFYGFCANTLFPYVRNYITTTLSQSGFKSILLSPINFEHLYLTKLREKQLQEKNKQASEKGNEKQTETQNSDNSEKSKKPSNLKVH